MSAELGAALYEHLSDRIPKAAREAVRRFPLVSQEDFEQEMWMRCYVSAEALSRYLKEDNEALIYHKLRDYGHRYGMQDDRDRRARKAAFAGYATWDEMFYTPQMAGHLVAELIQSEWDLPFAMDRATKGTDLTGVRVQSGGDSHDSFMDYLALLTDVKTAHEKLNKGQQNTLLAWYGVGNDEYDEQCKWDREALANSMGITYNALEHRKRRALATLLHELGGENPWIRREHGENGQPDS